MTTPRGLDPSRKLPFVCLGSECPNTCCGPFHGTRALQAALTHADLGAVLLGINDPPEPEGVVSIFALIRLSDTDLRWLQDAGLDRMVVRRGTMEQPAYYLKIREDGTCAALDSDRRCKIYAHRPTLCRAFPFYFDLFAGLSMVSSCPGVDAGQSTVGELQTEILAAVEMYELWLAEVRSALEGGSAGGASAPVGRSGPGRTGPGGSAH